MHIVKRLNETILVVTLTDGSKWQIFPRHGGGTITSAQTIVNGAIRGMELALQPAFADGDTDDRLNTNKELINVLRIVRAVEKFVPVPASITNLYEAPEGETEEAKAVRESTVLAYFETR